MTTTTTGTLDEVLTLDAVGQADLVRRGQVSAEELVAAAITRIETRDLDLNAVVIREFDRAVDAARRVLGALRLVAQAVGSSPSPWALASLITGGKLLGTTTDPPWTLPGGRRVMPPVP